MSPASTSPSPGDVLAADRSRSDDSADGASLSRGGDAEAAARRADVESVYRAHVADVTRWVSRLAGPDGDVEDIVHDVFLVVERRLRQFRGDAKITTWLYEIAVRIVHSRRRRKRWLGWIAHRGSPRPGEMAAVIAMKQAATDAPSALDLLEREETSRTVYAMLEKLPEKYRTVLILFELEGLSGEDIASITGTSVANVWVRLFRGREKILRSFQELEARGSR